MHRVYELFEVSANSSPQKITAVPGLESAKAALQDFAKHTGNECFAADSSTHQIVMQLNVPRSRLRRIFLICYDVDLAVLRAELLRSRGYGVISVIGNDAAKVLLSSIQPYDLFIVGDAAPQEIRREMADWLKSQYPAVKILALNPPDQQLPVADYNAPEKTPENWLPIIFQHLASAASMRGA